MASLTQWTWVWVNSGSWWWTGRPGTLQSMGLQRIRRDLATELNWTEDLCKFFILSICYFLYWTSQVVPVVKRLPANAGDIRDTGLIPGSGKSPGKGHGNPLLYSCLENPMDRGGCKVHKVAKKSDMTEMTQHTQISYIAWKKLVNFVKDIYILVFTSSLE